MSNTMKIIANRKNRNENGIRALWLGSNPHSNGEDFSRSFRVRIVRRRDRPKIIMGRATATIDDVISMYITQKRSYIMIKSQVLYFKLSGYGEYRGVTHI